MAVRRGRVAPCVWIPARELSVGIAEGVITLQRDDGPLAVRREVDGVQQRPSHSWKVWMIAVTHEPVDTPARPAEDVRRAIIAGLFNCVAEDRGAHGVPLSDVVVPDHRTSMSDPPHFGHVGSKFVVVNFFPHSIHTTATLSIVVLLVEMSSKNHT